MARKSTISKVLIHHSDRGFTLLELLVGMVIMSIVGGLALNAIVEAGKSYGNDKRNIESSQNLSAVLEMVGNDIKQAGEQLPNNDNNFPAVELRQETSSAFADGSPIQRSTLIVRRALVANPLTLCAPIAAGAAAGTTALTVRDSALDNPVGTNPNCAQNTAASANPSPLREAVNYRCRLGDPNFTYDPAQDSCIQSSTNSKNDINLQNVLVAVSRRDGNMCTFRYSEQNLLFSATQSRLVNLTQLSTCATAVDYATNSPIYLIEERRYTLDPINGNLTLSVNGRAPETLIGGIARFKVSARGYQVSAPGATPVITLNDRRIDPTGGGAGFACTAADGVSMPTTASEADPTYACRLNFGANTANWKQIAGIRIELQAKYDATGRASYANARPADIEKLQARAEFFPRNVLSR
jgi:prepilin-type N-terminal cleavage/methylation domain-containing protein